MRTNHSWLQRAFGWTLLSVAFVVGTASAVAAVVVTLDRFVLAKGDAVFWDGPPDIDGDPNDNLRPPGCEERFCVEYELVLLETAARLRVALDQPDDLDLSSGLLNPPAEPTDNGDTFILTLVDPTGNVKASGPPRYSVELAVRDPMVGTWKARVEPYPTNTDSTFRMRAKLEAELPNETGNNVRMPNLRLTPPFEFVAGADFKAGVAPTGCLARELLPREDGGDGARQCLRFSFGPENIGGPLELRVGVPGYSTPTGGTVIQRIYRSDGTVAEEREAGTYEFHPEHLHFHVDHYANSELYRVTDLEAGTLELAGPGRKQGFCTADMAIARWHRFSNDPTNDPGPGEAGTCTAVGGETTGGLGGSPLDEAVIALSPGWADIYAYYLEGNYVEFGDNPSGFYVVRVLGNDDDSMYETTSADNHSYALIEVVRDALTGVIHVQRVLERGYGTDPWDPHKRITTDIRDDCVAGACQGE